MGKDCGFDDRAVSVAFLVSQFPKTITVSGELGKELPIENVITFNRANIKRLANDPNTSRTTLRKMSDSEYASHTFKGIISFWLRKPKDHGKWFTKRKRAHVDGILARAKKF